MSKWAEEYVQDLSAIASPWCTWKKKFILGLVKVILNDKDRTIFLMPYCSYNLCNPSRPCIYIFYHPETQNVAPLQIYKFPWHQNNSAIPGNKSYATRSSSFRSREHYLATWAACVVACQPATLHNSLWENNKKKKKVGYIFARRCKQRRAEKRQKWQAGSEYEEKQKDSDSKQNDVVLKFML